MNSGSGQSYMDKLKARNIPPALQEAMEETAPEQMVEQEIPMVQISAEEWMRLSETVRRMEALSAQLSAQKEATETALYKVTTEAAEQVGKASEKAAEVIDRRIIRDEAIWWIRLALTALPTILVLLLWARVGLGI